MKKILLAVFSIMICATVSIAQTAISFTMRQTGTNKVTLFVRSNVLVEGQISQVLLTVTLPKNYTPRPTATITSKPNYSYITYISTPVYEFTVPGADGGDFAVYNFVAVPTSTEVRSFPANTEIEFVDIEFTGGGDGLAQLRLAGLPNGGTNEISSLNLEVGGTNRANVNSLMYGPGAVNSANGYEGYSFLPLDFVLPVNFLSFYAIKNGDDAKLNWTVENDENNNYFSLERSTDGRNFKPFGQLPALSNGRNSNTYETIDPALTKHGSRSLYYRIKQVDKSGIATYSDIRIVDVEGATQSINLFPNPAKSFTKVVIDAPQAMRATINLRDQSGKQVQVIPVQLQKGINQQEINVSALPSGEYNLNVNGVGFNPKAVKLIKIN